MLKRIALIGAAALWSGGCLFADFSYEQTSKLTGGMMAGMMKVMGVLSKQAREPIHTTVLLKGDRLAHVSPQHTQIIDLGKETITEINFQKKAYSVITFAQMAEALKQLEAKLRDEKGQQQMNITVKPSVKETGQTRQISGLDTHQVLVTIEMEGTDPKTGQTGVFMVMTGDMWLAPKIPGYEEVRSFYQRMAQKLTWAPGSGMFAQGRSDVSKGMSEMYKEMSKLNGVPVFQVMKMGAPVGAQGQPPAGAETPPPQQQQQPQQQAESPSVGGALGRLGGRLGGLGGLGRKKKQEQQPESQPQPQGQQQQAGSPGSLMEVTTELSGFSSGSVDASKFEVPAGFKQVENEMFRQR